jgi:prepilin-type processing-associated H-X9-DG protein
MQFSLRLVLEVTVVCAALLATVFVWGKVGFVVVFLILTAITGLRGRPVASIALLVATIGLSAIFIGQGSSQTTWECRLSRSCASNMHQIAIALFAYESTHGEFPPAYTIDAQGNRLHSWRTLILRDLECQDLYDKIRFDEPWDSPYNSQFHSVTIRIFKCPDRRSDRPCTHYVAVVGPNTVWPRTGSRSADDLDDPSNTIVLVEVENSDIHWMEPRDLEFDQMSMEVNADDGPGISGLHLSDEKRGLLALDIWYPGANVAFADGHTQFLPVDTSPEELRAMLMVKKKAN